MKKTIWIVLFLIILLGIAYFFVLKNDSPPFQDEPIYLAHIDTANIIKQVE